MKIKWFFNLFARKKKKIKYPKNPRNKADVEIDYSLFPLYSVHRKK